MDNKDQFSQHQTLLSDNNLYFGNEHENSIKICRGCQNKLENMNNKNYTQNPKQSNISTEVNPRKKCWQRFMEAEVRDIKSWGLWRAGLAEFLGTFLLCFFHIGIIIWIPGKEPPPLLHISIGHGLYVAAVVTALGATGGCHMNPAVTMAFCSLRQTGLARAVTYIISQCGGAIAGTLVLRELTLEGEAGNLGLISPGQNVTNKQVIFTEMIVTAFLLVVVGATSDKSRSDIQGSVPLIVGLTVTVNTILTNQVSGSCMNPARALGPAVVMGDYKNFWMYLLGPCSGALIGAHLYTKCLAPSSSNNSLLGCCRGQDMSGESRHAKEDVKAILELEKSLETDL